HDLEARAPADTERHDDQGRRFDLAQHIIDEAPDIDATALEVHDGTFADRAHNAKGELGIARRQERKDLVGEVEGAVGVGKVVDRAEEQHGHRLDRGLGTRLEGDGIYTIRHDHRTYAGRLALDELFVTRRGHGTAVETAPGSDFFALDLAPVDGREEA